MQNMVQKLVTIFVVLGICLAVIIVKEPTLGRDLRGGVSLIYSVDIGDDVDNPQEVLTQTITVLKDRVNPTGVIDIQMEPLGRDRIQITMPLPNAEVRALREEAERALRTLVQDAEIDRFALRDALGRGAAVQELAGGDPEGPRGEALAALQVAYDAREAATAALEALPADASAAERRLREQELAIAQIDYEDAEARALELSLEESRVRRILTLSGEPEPERDAQGERVRDEDGKLVFGPSPRRVALNTLKTEFPFLAEQIDGLATAWEAYQSQVTGFDDPEDLKRLLRGAGVLDFRIAVSSINPEGVDAEALREELRESGPVAATSGVARWYPINAVDQWYDEPADFAAMQADPAGYFAGTRALVAEEFDGRIYLLLYTTRPRSLTHEGATPWSLTSAGRTVDQLGRPAVAFNLDQSGASQMGRLTGGNIGEPMAIVLDGEVYSAPTIQGQITSQGSITGEFSQEDIDYLIRVLAAGSLSAKLGEEPISVSVLGPSLGADNLRRGSEAFVIAIIAVAVFMTAYYLTAGLVAVLALAANGLVIFGALMLIDGTFTLPGLAGIVLTIGMAVDANVLIYERIREEMFAGELDLRGCIRQGYAKALSTIIDANITNLIVCLVLFQTATTEVKGFALTLSIGICATLFTALFMTRQIFLLYTEVLKKRELAMLPVVIPSIHRALEPSIDWIGKRMIFWSVSIVAVVGSLALVSSRGVDMLDTEFRGGVALKIATEPVDADDDGVPDTDEQGDVIRVLVPHTGPDGVENRIRSIGERAAELAPGVADLADSDPSDVERVLQQFGKAQVLTVGRTGRAEDGSALAGEFQVKVAAPEDLRDDATITDIVVSAIVDELGELLDINPSVTFIGADAADATPFAQPITDEQLSRAIDRPQATERVPQFVGGVAILLDELDPPIVAEEIERRIQRTRDQPDFREYAGRRVGVIPLEAVDPRNPAAGLRSAVVLVQDPALSYTRPDVDPAAWRDGLADPEWEIVTIALGQPESLDEVNSYSSSVAQTLQANATVAVTLSLLGILIYIWVRFGSLRYSVAAIVALVHDVTIALGLLALTGIVGTTALGSALLIEPFRIDLGVIAALLTIIGYSLNDTIVILDRIREERGKLPVASKKQVNLAINRTVSRTLLTSVTTLMAVLIMYAEGGSGIRPFTFCLLVGLLVGTYSSVAIAAPLVFAKSPGDTRPSSTPLAPTDDRPDGTGPGGDEPEAGRLAGA